MPRHAASAVHSSKQDAMLILLVNENFCIFFPVVKRRSQPCAPSLQPPPLGKPWYLKVYDVVVVAADVLMDATTTATASERARAHACMIRGMRRVEKGGGGGRFNRGCWGRDAGEAACLQIVRSTSHAKAGVGLSDLGSLSRVLPQRERQPIELGFFPL